MPESTDAPPAPPRIAPLEEPYAPEIREALERWMPPGSDIEPLALFRTLVVHPDLASRMRPLGAGILGHGLLPAREREIVIDRTCALAGAEYEWGVHAVAFAAVAGLSEEQLAATARDGSAAGCWSERDILLLRLCEELHATSTISDDLWQQLAAGWNADQLIELMVIAGWYHLVAYVINGCRIPLEDWAARFPVS
jgi:4-carboxymuconolactone decarboxylase